MRLIKTDSKEVVHISSSIVPPYVILSHTWEQDGGEVTLQEMMEFSEKAKTKPGFSKIEQCCAKAREDQFDYAWIDTCW
jgi:hypothetical protein